MRPRMPCWMPTTWPRSSSRYSSIPNEWQEVGQNIAEEVNEINDFLEELAKRRHDESKMRYLHNELDEAFKGDHDSRSSSPVLRLDGVRP